MNRKKQEGQDKQEEKEEQEEQKNKQEHDDQEEQNEQEGHEDQKKQEEPYLAVIGVSPHDSDSVIAAPESGQHWLTWEQIANID